MCDDQVEVLRHYGVCPQITQNIDPIQLAICRHLSADQLFHLYIRHQRNILTYVGNHILGAEFYAEDIQIDSFVNAASVAFHHPPPVCEGRGDQSVWWNRADRVVPVAYLDGVQGDFHDCSVGASVRHLDPVSDADHIVLRELYPGHKSENTVLEHQHQHCCGGSKSGQKS